MKVFYMAHPVGGDVEANLARAERWFIWLNREYTGLVVIAPWITELRTKFQDDRVHKQRLNGLNRQAEVVRRMDGIFLCGGRISAGMQHELNIARHYRLEVVDLCWLGAEPPGEHGAGDHEQAAHDNSRPVGDNDPAIG